MRRCGSSAPAPCSRSRDFLLSRTPSGFSLVVRFPYALRLADGTDAGEAEYADTNVQAGDMIRVDGNRKMHVLAVIPLEVATEFVDDAIYGVLEVEPAP